MLSLLFCSLPTERGVYVVVLWSKYYLFCVGIVGLSGACVWSGGLATRFLLIFWMWSLSVVLVLLRVLLMVLICLLTGLRNFWVFWLLGALCGRSLWVILVVIGLLSVVWSMLRRLEECRRCSPPCLKNCLSKIYSFNFCGYCNRYLFEEIRFNTAIKHQ